jgi:hypothetical protein
MRPLVGIVCETFFDETEQLGVVESVPVKVLLSILNLVIE